MRADREKSFACRLPGVYQPPVGRVGRTESPRLCWNKDTAYSARSLAQSGARLDAASAPGQFAWNKTFQRWFSP